MSTDWSPRLADIPGIRYPGDSKIDRRKLPGWNSRPQVDSFKMDGEIRYSLNWSTPQGSTSQSPASTYADEFLRPEQHWNSLVRHLYECLELPGEPSDYHFAIMGCYDQIWKLRVREPETLVYLECLCQLDIQLLEVCPKIITNEGNGNEVFYLSVPAFDHLISIYAAEGFLHEALAIAKQGAVFEQGADSIETLELRIRAVEEEHS